MPTLSIKAREPGKKVAGLRSEGSLPAVFYGPKDDPESIALDAAQFELVLREEGESSVITLEGDDMKKDVLIHDMQTHPVSGAIEHVDFYVIDKTKKVEVAVPLEFVGEAPAVKNLGGVLVKVLYEIEIEVLPTEIPQEINVDVSSLTDFESQIHVSDLTLPEGVELITSPEEVVALTEEPREEEPEEPEEEMSIEDIEREGEKTEEEEGKEEGGESSQEEEGKEE